MVVRPGHELEECVWNCVSFQIDKGTPVQALNSPMGVAGPKISIF